MIPLGTVPANSTLYIPFCTYDGGDGNSVTCTGLAVTDVEIYKNGSTTQRASDAGIALLDTDGIDFDSITGLHGFSIDLSDNTDAMFYEVGSWYWVVVSSITVDSQTVTFLAAVFRIGPAEVVTGYAPVDIAAISGDTTAANTLESYCDGTTPQPVNVTHWEGDAVETTNENGVPVVDVGYVGGSAASGVATIDANVIEWKGDTAPAMTGDAYAAVGTLTTKIGTPAGADLAADVAAIKTETASILEDTATTIPATLTTISGYVDCLPASWVTVPTAVQVRTEIDSNSTQLAAIVADTNELQTDWVNGGRLDLIVDAILEDTGTTIPDAFPTNFSDLAIAPTTGYVTAGSVEDKTGYYLASAQTCNITGSITGNLSGSVGSVTGAVASVTGNVGGNVVGSVASVAAGVTLANDSITAAAIAASAVTEIQAGLATAAALDAVDNYVDTEVAAIKAVTDKLDTIIEVIP